MKLVTLEHSKSKIDRSGEILKGHAEEAKFNEALEVLSSWRAYHAIPLDTFAKVLKERVKKISKKQNALVAQRLKRTPSILLKLRRHSTMRLSTMQDIGGVRAVLDSIDEVNKLVEIYRVSKTRHKLFSINDYILSPKSDGYRSIHLVYQLNKTPQIFIEIQVRTYLQHIWATAVEVFGTLKNSSFKSGDGESAWLDFFAHLSSFFALKEGQTPVSGHQSLSAKQLRAKLKKMIHELRAIEQLNVYTAIYKITANNPTKGRSGSYSLILLNSDDNTINIQTFSNENIEEATEAYTRMEKEFYEDIHKNVVLVNSGDVKKLEMSYPNYFMDTRQLVRLLSQIMIDEY